MPGAESLAQSSLHYSLVRKSPRCALFNCSPPTHEGVPLPQLPVSYHEPRTTLYQFCPNAVSREAYFIFHQHSGPHRAAFIKPRWPPVNVCTRAHTASLPDLLALPVPKPEGRGLGMRGFASFARNLPCSARTREKGEAVRQPGARDAHPVWHPDRWLELARWSAATTQARHGWRCGPARPTRSR